MIRRTAYRTFVASIAAGAVSAAAVLSGCASTGTIQEKTSLQWYDQGVGLSEKKRYDEAVDAFKEASRGYRGADLDADIQLALADAYFGKEEYPAAAESYGEFLRLHPHNARADYAQYQIGLSWQRQLRRADQTQEPARKAAAAYEALLRSYPRSSLLDQGREGLLLVRRRMAEHELTVADFYRRKEKYRAAAGRYEVVLRDFADLGYVDRVLYELGGCYGKLKDQEKSDLYYFQLRRDFPQSQYVKNLENSKG